MQFTKILSDTGKWGGALCLGLLAGGELQAAGIAPQLSHRAVYQLQLSEAIAPGVSGVEGKMVVEWRETCEGYLTEQRIVIRTDMEDGKVSLNDVSTSSWEALDGSEFRFDLRQLVDNKLMEVLRGDAKAGDADNTAHAIFKQPASAELSLPESVLFPSRHMEAVLEAAASGKSHVAAVLFDGSSDKEYYKVLTSIGQKQETGMTQGWAAGQHWWPVQISFYSPFQPEAEPQFEMSFHLFANGVTENVSMRYRQFVLAGELQEVTAFPVPDC